LGFPGKGIFEMLMGFGSFELHDRSP